VQLNIIYIIGTILLSSESGIVMFRINVLSGSSVIWLTKIQDIILSAETYGYEGFLSYKWYAY
jgi:hypothetical protein